MDMHTILTLTLQRVQTFHRRTRRRGDVAEQEAERSMLYDDDEQCHLHQYGGRDLESEEYLGFIQPEWPQCRNGS
jgi:hypothetical protein